MSSPESPNEGSPERIPSREEIIALIRRRFERMTVLREPSDERGIYLLEAEGPTGTLYIYQRHGRFPNENASAATVLEMVYLSDGIPCGGEIIAKLDPSTNEWSDK